MSLFRFLRRFSYRFFIRISRASFSAAVMGVGTELVVVVEVLAVAGVELEAVNDDDEDGIAPEEVVATTDLSVTPMMNEIINKWIACVQRQVLLRIDVLWLVNKVDAEMR